MNPSSVPIQYMQFFFVKSICLTSSGFALDVLLSSLCVRFPFSMFSFFLLGVLFYFSLFSVLLSLPTLMWLSFFPPITVGLVREFFLRMLVNSKALLEPDFSLLGWLTKGLSIGTCFQWGLTLLVQLTSI